MQDARRRRFGRAKVAGDNGMERRDVRGQVGFEEVGYGGTGLERGLAIDWSVAESRPFCHGEGR